MTTVKLLLNLKQTSEGWIDNLNEFYESLSFNEAR